MTATFFVDADEPMSVGRAATIGETEAHHALVRRLAVGERVRLVDGRGTVAHGALSRLARGSGTVDVDRIEAVEPPAEIHLLVPIADRDRMLWLAEKATELGVASWRPVMWRRSRSVSPRGEGVSFQSKVRARMIAALTQSGGAWLPALFPDAPLDRAIAAAPRGTRWLLDAQGDAILPLASSPAAPLTIAVGPEGGVEDAEREQLVASGFSPVGLALTTLRFETAAVAALAVARASLFHTEAARG